MEWMILEASGTQLSGSSAINGLCYTADSKPAVALLQRPTIDHINGN